MGVKCFDKTHRPELAEGEGLACLPVGRGRSLQQYVFPVTDSSVTIVVRFLIDADSSEPSFSKEARSSGGLRGRWHRQ